MNGEQPARRNDRASDESEPTLCVACGADVSVLSALVYHGNVYHWGCATGPEIGREGLRRQSLLRPRTPAAWPLGVPEFNCAGDL